MSSTPATPALRAGLLVALLAATAALAVTTSASAHTFTPVDGANLQAALGVAAGNDEDDTITLAPETTYTRVGGFLFNTQGTDFDNHLTIDGNGATLSPTTATEPLRVNGGIISGGVTLNDLTVTSADTTTVTGILLSAPATLTNVTVNGPASTTPPSAGIQSYVDLKAQHLTVATTTYDALAIGAGTATVDDLATTDMYGVAVHAGAGAVATVRGAVLGPANAAASSPTGLLADGPGTQTTAERVRITGAGRGARAMQGATIALRDSLVSAMTPNGVALQADDANSSGAFDSALTAERVTLAGSGGNQVGAWADGGSVAETDHATVTVRDSTLTGVKVALRCSESNAQSQNAVTLERTNATATQPDENTCADGSGDPGITRTGVTSLDPGFADPAGGDFHLAAGSPLIDAGPTATEFPGLPTTDLGGSARLTDGDADGIARLDLGAFEYQAPVPPPATDGPAAPSGTPTPAPGLTPGPGPDRLAPILSALKLTPRRDARTGHLTLRVRFTLSEPGTVRLTLLRRKGRKLIAVKGAARTLGVTDAGAVTATWKTKLRATSGARYRLQAKPKDAAGNGGGTKAAAVIVP